MFVCYSCSVIVGRVTGGELFDEIVAREFYSEHDARWVALSHSSPPSTHTLIHTHTLRVYHVIVTCLLIGV